MPEISIRVEQTVQITPWSHQRVAVGVSGLTPEQAADDEYIQGLVSGPIHKTYGHLSKAVIAECDKLRSRERERMIEETREQR